MNRREGDRTVGTIVEMQDIGEQGRAAARLERVFDNLPSNGIEYSPEGATATWPWT